MGPAKKKQTFFIVHLNQNSSFFYPKKRKGKPFFVITGFNNISYSPLLLWAVVVAMTRVITWYAAVI